MKALNKVFIRVFVKEFFRINAGFFFVAVGFFFGILSGREHMALAQAFVSSYIVLLIPITIWILYALKIFSFNKMVLTRSENTFLYTASELSSITLWRSTTLIALLQFTPVLAYSLFVSLIAIQTHHLGSLAVIITVLCAIIFFLARGIYTNIHQPDLGKTISRLKSRLDHWLTKPFYWFYPEWIIRQQPLIVIGTKIFACLIIIGTSRLYLFDTYDSRLLAMGCTLAFTSNLVIVYFYHRFENFHFALMRSLPLRLPKRILSFLITIGLLNFCELGILINYFPDVLSISELLLIIFYGLSVYGVAYSFLFTQDLTLELFIQKAGIAAFVWIILILFKAPLLIIALLHFIVGYIIYQKNFYQFEFKAELDSEK